MILTAIIFFVLLSVLVLIHEFGHFFTAKWFGIKVEEFGFGLPPRIWGKKVGETIYSINALPIGGFVRLYGEDQEEDSGKSDTTDPVLAKRAFYNRPLWQRAIVLTAGVSMNFLLALVILSFLFTRGVPVPSNRVHIEDVVADSPAQIGGLQKYDIILSINEKPITSSKSLVDTINMYLGQRVNVTVLRGANFEQPVQVNQCAGCSRVSLAVVPRKESPAGQGPMGISISNYEIRAYSWYQAPVLGLKEAVTMSYELIKGLGTTLWRLVTFHNVSQDVAGPIGIAKVTGEARKYGFMAVLELMGLLSLNLAIMNILPFPALDGGRLFFVVFEALTGKKIRAEWERRAHQVGMIILLGLILVITINDFLKLFGKG